MLLGKSLCAAFKAACTSRAAPLMSRSRLNCKTIRLAPSALVEVISVMPAMRPSERSSGVVTAAAMVSGLAPGSDAETLMVGMSTLGKGEMGNNCRALMPTNISPKVNSVVATGLLMKGALKFMGAASCPAFDFVHQARPYSGLG